MTRFVFIFLSIAAFLSCTTIKSTVNPDIEKKWKYTVVIIRAGTKRECERGRLYYKKKEIKGCFSSIIIGDSKYDYLIGRTPLDFEGYKLDEEHIHKEMYVEGSIDDDDMRRGWYSADADKKKRGTPADWIWIRRENLGVFINPRKMNSFIQKYDLLPIIQKSGSQVNVRIQFSHTF